MSKYTQYKYIFTRTTDFKVAYRLGSSMSRYYKYKKRNFNININNTYQELALKSYNNKNNSEYTIFKCNLVVPTYIISDCNSSYMLSGKVYRMNNIIYKNMVDINGIIKLDKLLFDDYAEKRYTYNCILFHDNYILFHDRNYESKCTENCIIKFCGSNDKHFHWKGHHEGYGSYTDFIFVEE